MRNLDNLHIPSTSMALVQKGVLYTGSKIFNHLPLHIKNTSRDHTLFKKKLKNFYTNICSTVWTNTTSYSIINYTLQTPDYL